MKFLTTVMHALLSYGSFWLMTMADSKIVLFIMGMFFAAFAVMTMISPRRKHIN